MAYYNICNVYEEMNNLEEAEKAIDKAIELDSTVPDFYYHLGYINAYKRNFEKALLYFEKVNTMEPNYIDAIYNIGVMSKILTNVEKAKQCFLKITEYDSEFILAHLGLASIYLVNDNFKLAKFELDISLSLSPSDPIARHTLALYYYNLKELEDALREINTAISIKSNDYVHKFLKVEILLAMKNFEEAKEMCFSIKKEIPEISHTYELLAQYYFAIEDFDKSIENYNMALVKNGTLMRSLEGLKNIYTIQNNTELLEEVNSKISCLNKKKGSQNGT
jgi:tetratricopeptide (TPR) repeat protein